MFSFGQSQEEESKFLEKENTIVYSDDNYTLQLWFKVQINDYITLCVYPLSCQLILFTLKIILEGNSVQCLGNAVSSR